MKKPLIYIITINWNGLEDTLESLDSLYKIKYPNYNIIVVDNGSHNNEPELIKEKFPDLQLIKNKENKGFAIANNQGMRIALEHDAKYILLLNNDTTVKNDFLNILVEYAEHNKDVGIVSPKILYYNSERIWSMGTKIRYIFGIPIHIFNGKNSTEINRIIEPDFASGCAMLIKKEVINKIGLLDQDYFSYTEDADFSYRARKAGYKIMVIPESIVWHKKSASAGIKGSNKLSPIQAYLRARNGIIFGKKNLKGIDKLSYLFGQFTFRLIYGIVYCIDGVSIKKYFLGLIHGMKYK